MRLQSVRPALAAAWLFVALPVTCSDTAANDLYTGGVQSSGPGGRINPAEPNLVNGGNGGSSR